MLAENGHVVLMLVGGLMCGLAASLPSPVLFTLIGQGATRTGLPRAP